MIFTSTHTNPLLFRSPKFRLYNRRKPKSLHQNLTICNHFPNPSSPFQNLFHTLISHFPSPTSLLLLSPAAGAALYLTQLRKGSTSDIGDWILFSSPTPFNRFVFLRCPLLESITEKVVEEDRDFVGVNSGRIRVSGGGRERWEEKLEYQRVCVAAEDGGVVSLDWPANLDLEAERGLDTTVLLVPGTAEGSMDRTVRSFVCEALRRGCFPVVMNPRGCAGSPLTTPRLFSAADSDDICTAIQFINNARPWTTLMSVGWGYGANMLTKYLAEVGEKTPLTAATCIDNPFDLEEATRSSPHHIAADQKLTDGLINILQSNKELFQGRTKGFDVEKALLSKSVRDFEEAISMVSYGFESIEHFYSKSSTRGMVGNVKIPVLFIQNDDGTVPLFSIPRSLIAENPCTSLLLCSCLPSSAIANCRSAISWCQHLTIEWLTAVELGLLKGRHPLLNDVDLAINPSKGLSLVEGIASDNSGKGNKVLDRTQVRSLNGYSIEPIEEILEESDTASSIHLRSARDSLRNLELEDKPDVDNGGLQQSSSVGAELVTEEEASSVGGERHQVIQSAQVVMNMLDVTMPDILTEEKKRKVLTAVNQGETLMKALEDAVPEDVRGKLTSAVSGILRTQGSNLKFDGLLGIGRISNVASGLKSNIQEKVGGISSAEGLNKDLHSSDQMKRDDDLADGFDNNQLCADKPAGGLESELFPSEKSQKSADFGQPQSTGQGGDIPSLGRKDTNESENNHENNEFSREKAAPYPDYSEIGSETDAKSNSPSWTEKAAVTEEAKVDEYKVNPIDGIAQLDLKGENNIETNEEKTLDSSTDQSKMTSSSMTEEALSPQSSSPEVQPTERDGSDNQNRENESLQPVQDPNKSTMSGSNSTTFSVSNALDALTGMDDSTQLAVNSVFGVIENMITQLEEGNDNDEEVKDRSEDRDKKIDSESKNQHIIDDHVLRNRGDNENDLSVQSDVFSKPPVHNWPENSRNSQVDVRTRCVEEKPVQNSILFNGGIDGSQENTKANYVGKGKSGKKDQLVGSKLLADNIDRHVNNIPLYVIAKPYGGSLQREYVLKYLSSKIPARDSLDMDSTTALLLDYFPEEGQWKLLEQPGNLGDSIGNVTTHKGVDRKVRAYSTVKANNTDKIIEPLYVILDSDKQQEPVEKYETMDEMNEKVEIGSDRSEELMLFVKNMVLDSLKVEVGRRLSAPDMKIMEPDLARDLEQVANAVSLAVRHNEHIRYLEGENLNVHCTSEKVGSLQGAHIIRAISSAVHDTSYLRRVLPVGVIVGSSLAALRKFFDVAAVHDKSEREAMTLGKAKKSGGKNPSKVSVMEIDQMPIEKSDQSTDLDSSIIREKEKTGLRNLNNDTVMVGAVTAALGASALLLQQQATYKGNETAESLSKSLKEKGSHQDAERLEFTTSDKTQNNIVTSFAEKAMSVASPVVPTKDDGGVDQERLVAMLADLGQKGGILKLVGKIALLWGGIRGAMSLTGKLISFLHIAERPLFQRILCFVGMVLVLWSPVVIPLIPTLVQSWTGNNPSKFAELACIIGLYCAIMTLIVLWGKRIREYENPFEQYGLDLTSPPKIQNFLTGLIGGVLLVLSIHFANVLLGYASLSWSSSLPSSSFDAVTWLKVYGQMFMLAGQGILTATGVAIVEELLFRSWLPEEIAIDLGYHRGIIISGLIFSLFQRSPMAIPCLWLLSLGLSGARQRTQGSLSIPIGLRAGILASSFVLQKGGFITYKTNLPLWVTGTHPFQPFSGAVGFAFSLLLAVILYPGQPLPRKILTETIRE